MMLWSHPLDRTLITHWVWEAGVTAMDSGLSPTSQTDMSITPEAWTLHGGTELLLRLWSTCLGLSGQVR